MEVFKNTFKIFSGAILGIFAGLFALALCGALLSLIITGILYLVGVFP